MRHTLAQTTEDQNEENAVGKERKDGDENVKVGAADTQSRLVGDDAYPGEKVDQLTKKPFFNEGE